MSETTLSKKIYHRPGTGTLIFTLGDFERNYLNGTKKVEKTLSLEEINILFKNNEFQEKLRNQDLFSEYILILFCKSIQSFTKSKEGVFEIINKLREKQKEINTKETYELILSVSKFFILNK